MGDEVWVFGYLGDVCFVLEVFCGMVLLDGVVFVSVCEVMECLMLCLVFG